MYNNFSNTSTVKMVRYHPGALVFTRCLEEEVRCITRKVSSNTFIGPTMKEIRSDLLNALDQYIYSIHTRTHQIKQAKNGKDVPTPEALSPTTQTPSIPTG